MVPNQEWWMRGKGVTDGKGDDVDVCDEVRRGLLGSERSPDTREAGIQSGFLRRKTKYEICFPPVVCTEGPLIGMTTKMIGMGGASNAHHTVSAEKVPIAAAWEMKLTLLRPTEVVLLRFGTHDGLFIRSSITPLRTTDAYDIALLQGRRLYLYWAVTLYFPIGR